MTKQPQNLNEVIGNGVAIERLRSAIARNHGLGGLVIMLHHVAWCCRERQDTHCRIVRKDGKRFLGSVRRSDGRLRSALCQHGNVGKSLAVWGHVGVRSRTVSGFQNVEHGEEHGLGGADAAFELFIRPFQFFSTRLICHP